MAKQNHYQLLILIVLLILSSNAMSTDVDVGVVLELGLPMVQRLQTSMSIAIEDYYAQHTNNNTFIAIHFRDSNNSTVHAAMEAKHLMSEVGVKVIIGPFSSSQAVFISDLGTKRQVPIVSFSATSPSLSTSLGSYFVRTTINDSSQVTAIASLVNNFQWREVVLIYEDTEYGSGFVPYLVDVLQEVASARVSYRYAIPISTTSNTMKERLRELMSMRTRVFVVHMTPPLGSKLFLIAKKLGMIGDGYFWIMTDGLTNVFNELNFMVRTRMGGVLGVRAHMPYSIDFSRRWREKIILQNQNSILDPTAYDLWAYDTVWTLAAAVEKFWISDRRLKVNTSSINASLVGRDLLLAIRETKFVGLSGNFSLVDGQLEPPPFELVNVAGGRLKSIGYWTPTHGISRYYDSESKLNDTEWPVKLRNQPRGWEWPTNRKKLRIGVPTFDGFKELTDKRTGLCVKVFEEALKELPYDVPHEYISYDPNASYDKLIKEVYLKNFDAVVGDMTISWDRAKMVDFTTPYTETGFVMVVPIKRDSDKLWVFLEPMTSGLWLVSGAFFIFTGVCVWLIEHNGNEAFQGTLSQQLGATFYFIFSTIVFSHQERVTKNLSRVVLIMWVFVILILTSSYTASLSSMLTTKQLQQSMITNVNSLIHNEESVGHMSESFIKPLLINLGFNDSKLKPYSSPKQYHEALSNGSVSAIFDEIPYIKVFLSKYPSQYVVVGEAYKSNGFGFVLPRGSPMLPDLSRAILRVKESDTMTKLEKNVYGDELFGPLTSLQEEDTSDAISLTLERFRGLFLITLVTSACALLLHLVIVLLRNINFWVRYLYY